MNLRFTGLHILFCLILVGTTLGQRNKGYDTTTDAGSFGLEVVNAVIDKIRSGCVFSEDRLFLRRLAYVVSNNGENPSTYRSGYHGGIWQINNGQFKKTQNCNNRFIAPACQNIKSAFGIDWTTVKWYDLRKPLYSGVAAVLATLMELGNSEMPGTVNEQAAIFTSVYRPTGDKSDFVKLADKASIEFDCRDKLDLLFILDSSGSVSSSDFKLMTQFASDVVNVMNISRDAIQVAEISFSSSTRVHFDFNDYASKSLVMSKLKSTTKVDGGTNTHLALNQAKSILSDSSRGARSNVKKVAVIVTDGQSASGSSTLNSAKALKDSGVTVFSIGVGNYDKTELQAMASDPVCTHVQTMTSFSHIKSILAEIQKSTCEASETITDTQASEGFLPVQKTFVTVVKDNTTIVAKAPCGVLNIFVSTTVSKPSKAVFDQKYIATPTVPAILKIVETLKINTPLYITIEGNRLPTSSGSSSCSDFSWTLMVKEKTKLIVQCIDAAGSRPCTEADFLQSGVCPAQEEEAEPNNPCTEEAIEKRIMRHSYTFDITKFIQCDLVGHQYLTSCPDNHVFNARTSECNFKSPVPSPNPEKAHSVCTATNIRNHKFYHPHPNAKKFIQCDMWGAAFEKDCAKGTKWSQQALTCIHDIQLVSRSSNNNTITSNTTTSNTTTSNTTTSNTTTINTTSNATTSNTTTSNTTTSSPDVIVMPTCTVQDDKKNVLLPDPCNHTRFYQCVKTTPVLMDCPGGLFYNPTKLYCDWTDTNSDPIPVGC